MQIITIKPLTADRFLKTLKKSCSEFVGTIPNKNGLLTLTVFLIKWTLHANIAIRIINVDVNNVVLTHVCHAVTLHL